MAGGGKVLGKKGNSWGMFGRMVVVGGSKGRVGNAGK